MTSLSDNGTSKRPRDARLIHLLLSSMGITAYQERVPLQLLDFAYRYTSSVLSDALHLKLEGYDDPSASTSGDAKGKGGKKEKEKAGDMDEITLGHLRTAISSRMGMGGQSSFGAGLPREYLMEVSEKRNKIALPVPGKGGEQNIVMAGMRLPSERYCLSGVGWGMKEEWESEGEEQDEVGDGVVDETMAEDGEDQDQMMELLGGEPSTDAGDAIAGDTEMGNA